MKVDHLEKCIIDALNNGCLPFMVIATAGTTVLGAFDPFEQIADICEKYKLWYHVDGSWGGSVLVSPLHRNIMKGAERANSFNWNPHKMLSIPLQCSALIFRSQGILSEVTSVGAKYLFQRDKKSYDVSYDTGDKAIQCGRIADVFKLWLVWKSKGDKGFRDQIDLAFENRDYFTSQLLARTGRFELVIPPQCLNICFWYIPPSLRGLGVEERKDKLNTVTALIKSRMQQSGSTLINYQPLGSWPNFFRMIIISPLVSKADLDFVLDEIENVGHDL